MTFIKSADIQEIQEEIISFANKSILENHVAEKFKVSKDEALRLSKLIEFLVKCNDAIVNIDEFSVTDDLVLVTALGACIDFTYKESFEFAKLTDGAKFLGCDTVKLNNGKEEKFQVVMRLSMPNVIVWGDENE